MSVDIRIEKEGCKDRSIYVNANPMLYNDIECIRCSLYYICKMLNSKKI